MQHWPSTTPIPWSPSITRNRQNVFIRGTPTSPEVDSLTPNNLLCWIYFISCRSFAIITHTSTYTATCTYNHRPGSHMPLCFQSVSQWLAHGSRQRALQSRSSKRRCETRQGWNSGTLYLACNVNLKRMWWGRARVSSWSYMLDHCRVCTYVCLCVCVCFCCPAVIYWDITDWAFCTLFSH